MFERFTEKARRTIFFARYEASQYGSPYIDTEHLLLGLLREDGVLVQHFLPTLGQTASIREEIEAHIESRERISTSVEVPLTTACKNILNFAGEEADRLGHRHIGTEHMLLGILREERCFAAQILKAKGIELLPAREALAKARPSDQKARRTSWRNDDAKERVAKFLNAWSAGNAKALSDWFVEDGVFVDVHGALWKGRLEIQTAAALHFTSRARVPSSVSVDELRLMDGQAAVANAIFEPAAASAAERERPKGERIRMTVILVEQDAEWLVVAAHATTIQSSPSET